MTQRKAYRVVQPYGRNIDKESTVVSEHPTAAEAFAYIDQQSAQIVRTGRGTIVVVQHAAQPLPPTHRTDGLFAATRLDKFVLEPLVVPLGMIMRHDLRHGTSDYASAFIRM